jgi:hypothetical protein
VNLITLAAEISWRLRNLGQGWGHIKLRIHFQPALPCCVDNGRVRPFSIASSKAIPLILLVSPKKFTLHHQTITDLFFKIIGQRWFPTK